MSSPGSPWVRASKGYSDCGPTFRCEGRTASPTAVTLRLSRRGSEMPKGSEVAEYVIRFLVGGAVVSAFSLLGDSLRPRVFAGLFGAAPSVALATLGIAVYHHGAGYAARQTCAMTASAVALAVYGGGL